MSTPERLHLIWKLLGIIACVIVLIIGMIWLAIDYLAARRGNNDSRVHGARKLTNQEEEFLWAEAA